MQRLVSVGTASILLLLAGASHLAAREALERRHQSFALPGAPVVVLPADLDRDGLGDLLVLVAYSEWDQIGFSETLAMDEVEGLVEMMTIVPALFDRRELYWMRGRADGGFERPSSPLELDPSILTVEQGPAGLPVVALTDEGLASVVPGPDGELGLRPLLSERSILSGAGALLPTLDVLQDVDGDHEVDLLLPGRRDIRLYLAPALRTAGEGGGRVAPTTSVGVLPPQTGRSQRPLWDYALPRVGDLDGDGRPELLMRTPGEPLAETVVLPALGGGFFGPPRRPLRQIELEGVDLDTSEIELVHFGDLDGDGVAELVVVEDLSDDDAGWRKEMRQAKRPPTRYRVYSMEPGMRFGGEPAAVFDAVGYSMTDDGGDDGFRLPGGFRDLDGDGRRDLIAITLDFSLLQAIRVLATKSVNIGLDFHVYCQGDDGGFQAVPDLDLSGRFRLRLTDLRLGQLSQFEGDFDGDGRADFVQLGRGRSVTVHLGRDGCRYAPDPDLVLRLEAEPQDLALVRIGDLDGDGLADLSIVQSGRPDERGETAPVRLDLYLSRGSTP